MNQYIIETIEQPTRYRRYENGEGKWTNNRALAQVFTERAREVCTLPEGGCWVIANEQPLSFNDALAIARGCVDYGGGYRSDDAKLTIFHHGIQTVVRALESAAEKGLSDPQIAVLYGIGRNVQEELNQQPMTAPHDSATCTLGADGGPCGMCLWAALSAYDFSEQQRQGASFHRAN